MDAKGNIEVWLQRLVDGMQDTVKQVIKRAVRNVYVSGDHGCPHCGEGGTWEQPDAVEQPNLMPYVHVT